MVEGGHPKSFAGNGRYLTVLLAVAIAFALLPSPALAKVQRMMLVPQSASVPAGGTHRAPAFCIDSHAATPTVENSFKAVSTSVGSVKVEVGGRSYTLADAIAQGMVEATGANSTEHVQITNLTGQEIRFKVEGESVLLPDTDMDGPEIAPMVKAIKETGVDFQSPDAQFEIWNVASRFNTEAAANRIGILPSSLVNGMFGDIAVKFGNSEYPVDPLRVEMVDEMVRSPGEPGKPAGFIVERYDAVELEATVDSPPLYVLYTGNGKPVFKQGADGLGELDASARQAWAKAGGAPPPRLALLAADPVRRDALALNLALAAVAAGGAGDVAVLLSKRYNWDVPKEWKEALGKEYVENIWPEGTAKVSKEGEEYVFEVNMEGAMFKARSRIKEKLAYFVALLRNILRDLAQLGDRELALAELDRLRAEIASYNAARLKAGAKKDSAVHVEGTVAGEVFKEEFVKVFDNSTTVASLAGAR